MFSSDTKLRRHEKKNSTGRTLRGPFLWRTILVILVLNMVTSELPFILLIDHRNSNPGLVLLHSVVKYFSLGKLQHYDICLFACLFVGVSCYDVSSSDYLASNGVTICE